MNEFELRRALRGLGTGHAPDHDLWPGIAARIARLPQQASAADQPREQPRPVRRARPLRGGWAVAAAVLLAVLVGVPSLRQQQAPVADATTPRVAAVDPQARSLQRQADALTLEYAAALEAMGGTPLPPRLAPVLSELDASATQIRAALRQDPQSGYLFAQLRRTYDQRLRLTQLALAGPDQATG